MEKNHSLFKSATIMMALMMLGKILGIYRDRIHGSYFGTESIGAISFSYASSIPKNFLDILFASAISGSFIPIFNTILAEKGKKEAYKLAYNFISIMFVFSVLVTGVCIILSPQIIEIMASNKIPDDAVVLSVSLLRLMFPIIIISGIAFSLVGVLQSLGEFTIPAVMSVLSNLIIILYYVFFLSSYGLFGLCIAYLVGWASQIIIQIPFLIKNDFKFKFYIDLKSPDIKSIVALMLPVMLSTWILPINSLVNVRAASLIGAQGVACTNSAFLLYLVISGVLVSSISNVIFPTLSKLNPLSQKKEFGEIMAVTIRVLFFLLIPMAFGLCAISGPVIRFFYQTGNFDAQSTLYTSIALSGFSVGMIGYGLQNVFSRAFYSLKDGKTPAITGIIAIIINGILSFFLVKQIGIAGPAIASSISITVAGIIMGIKLYKINPFIFNKEAFFDIIKMFVIGIIMFFITRFALSSLNNLSDSFINKIITIAFPTLVGVVVYLGLAYLLKLKEIQFVIDKITSK